jgi:hypothetical protein
MCYLYVGEPGETTKGDSFYTKHYIDEGTAQEDRLYQPENYGLSKCSWIDYAS